MASEDIAAGRIKRVRGKANDAIGAIRGDAGQQLKGKLQQGVGRAQEEFGKATSRSRSRRRRP